MQITKLTDDRFDGFFPLVKSMVAEAEFNEAIPERQIIWNIYKNPNVLTLLAISNNKIIGFMAVVKGVYFFSTKPKISDIGLFVLPEFRGTSAAIKLLKAVEAWAKENNISDICIGQTTAVNMEKTQQFYNRLGYKTVGFNTIKHLEK